MKKKHILLAIALILIASFTACGGNDTRDETGADDAIIETYIYLPESLPMPQVTDLVQTAMVREGRIYYTYVTSDGPDSAAIIVASMLPDGTPVARTEIPSEYVYVDIAGLHITEVDTLALIVTNAVWTERGRDASVWYLEYTRAGEQIVRRELEGLVPQGSNWFHAGQAVFVADGNLALLASGDRSSFVYLLDEQFTVRGRLDVNMSAVLSQTRDGRVVVADSGGASGTTLREIDFAARAWGEEHSISVPNIQGLYPALDGAAFDLYIDDGTHFFGYTIATDERTLLLEWLETRVRPGFVSRLNVLDDGRISLLISHGDFAAEDWRTEHIILTRTARADLPEHEIITLGGFGVWENVRDMVREFNRNSQTHQIEIRDYYTSGSDTMEDFFTAEFRFMMDVLTGQAPDIIVGSPSSLATLAERDLLVDLYSLIDADPVLSRDDFLPNILRTMEAPDGSLPMISNSFIIETIIGLADVVGDIESWTFAEMLALIERAEAAGMEFFLAEFFTAERFLHTAILYSDEDFIDWSENRVNVDNEAFIQLLEIAYRLPHVMADHSMEEWMALPDPIIRMLRGEQLIDFVDIRDIDAYQMLAGMLGEDFVALGMPTRDGGAHAVRASAGFAISATSTQQDAAWSFIRRALMPYFDGMNEEEALGWRFPLRVDLYEAMIVEARTPLMEIDADGNEEEVPRGGRGGGHFMVYLYAMTEAEERGFRAIVETASIAGRFDDRVMEMILEETLPFFAGDRSAADTARILQNRLQMYLSERR